MSALSNYLETKIVDFWLRAGTATAPATVYLALFESDPGEDATGTETGYTNYARQAAVWTALDINGQTKNDTNITFPANGNASSSVTITHAAVFDASRTASQVAAGTNLGNMLLKGPLASSKNLAPGDVLSFAQSALTLTLD